MSSAHPPARKTLYGVTGQAVVTPGGRTLGEFSTPGDAAMAAGLMNQAIRAYVQKIAPAISFVIAETPDGWKVIYPEGSPMPASYIDVELWKIIETLRERLSRVAPKSNKKIPGREPV